MDNALLLASTSAGVSVLLFPAFGFGSGFGAGGPTTGSCCGPTNVLESGFCESRAIFLAALSAALAALFALPLSILLLFVFVLCVGEEASVELRITLDLLLVGFDGFLLGFGRITGAATAGGAVATTTGVVAGLAAVLSVFFTDLSEV